VNTFGKNLVFWMAIALFMIFLLNIFQEAQDSTVTGAERIAYSDFMADARGGRVSNITIQGDEITGNFASSGESFRTLVPPNENVVDRLENTGVQIEAKEIGQEPISVMSIVISLLPAILIIGVWIFFMRQMQGKGGGGAMGFGKSKAKLLNEKQGRVTFEDVAGIEEAKQELEEVVEFLKDPQKFQRLGGKIPKGALLIGRPGTGKTLVARAVAGEANVPFFTISGSDFVEMFVGVGASRVRDMFEQGKKNAPCIIFIDEIDAVGRHRGSGMGGGNDEREQTLNQMLVEMDGFETNEGVIILAATNRPDVLDPALLRPGRFDRQIVVGLADVKGREKILKVHMKKVPLANNVEASVIARGTPGFSGADLANLVNEAALLAARKNKRVVSMEDFEEAKDKVLMGAERKSMVMSDQEKKLTAYHEAGHAIVALNEPASDPVHKATIVPRGRALGVVMRLPVSDRLSMARDKLEADLAVAMFGRVAEEIIFGHDKVTTGASSDIKQATSMARKMVVEWGLSDKVGPLDYSGDDDAFSGIPGRKSNISDEKASLIDSEIQRIVNGGYDRAKQILTDRMDDLHKLAKALLEYEILSGDEIKDLLAGKKIVREDNDDEPKDAAPKSSVPSGGGLGGVGKAGELPQGT
jgi:cell division protease FtsH